MDCSVFPAPLPFGIQERQPGGKTRRDNAGQEFNPGRVRDAAKIQFGSHPRLWSERSVNWGDGPRRRSEPGATIDEKQCRHLKDTEQETALAGSRMSHGQDVSGGPMRLGITGHRRRSVVQIWNPARTASTERGCCHRYRLTDPCHHPQLRGKLSASESH